MSDDDVAQQEVDLLECVYPPEDVQVTKKPNGAIIKVTLTLMRVCPVAVLFPTPRERQDALDEASTYNPPERTARFVYAKVCTQASAAGVDVSKCQGDSDEEGDDVRIEVPVGYLDEKLFNVVLYVGLPHGYPDAVITDLHVDAGGRLSREYNDALKDVLKETAESMGECGAPVLQSLMEAGRGYLQSTKADQAQAMIDSLKDSLERGDVAALPAGDGDDEELAMANAAVFQHFQLNPFQIGRRCIYFHHILATGKRMFIQTVARKLQLQGFCKIGYPGILIVEGTEDACEIYVQMLQRLRWKLMVVRGEERANAPLGVDKLRKMTKLMVDGGRPTAYFFDTNLSGKKASKKQIAQAKSNAAQQKAMGSRRQDSDDEGNGTNSQSFKSPTVSEGGVWETTCASEIGQWSKACDLEDLFRTSMKIYT